MVTDVKTLQEKRAMRAFHNMDERRKCEVLDFMERIAKRFPLKQAPKLRIIQGGPS